MPSAVIASAVRTAIGTSTKGALRDTSAFDLADAVLSESIRRSGIAVNDIDDVVFAESGAGGGTIARHAAVRCGIDNASGLAVNRACAGGLAAVAVASGSIMAGMDRVVVAGGVHSTSTQPIMRWRIPGTDEYVDPWRSPSHPNSEQAPNLDMSITVGWNTAVAAGVERRAMDEWAVRSHSRAVSAIDRGAFVDEIVALKVSSKDGVVVDFATDEHPRRGSTVEKLSTLRPIHPEIEGFSITAGNSSGINDAASALVIADEQLVITAGAEPLAYVSGWSSAGGRPALNGLSTVTAISKLLERTGRAVSDIALWEINEAFAVVPIAVCAALDIDDELVNVSGSGCSLGHPVAASGARMLTTMVHELRRRGGGLGVAAMCAAGGQSGAVLIEVR